MRVIGINGSPRRGWNTDLMVQKAIEGAAGAGAETKLYQLSEIDFKGCQSCFACLRLGAPTLGKCSYNDALKPIIDDILASDGLIVGSPVYFGDVTAAARALFERLWFGGLSYGGNFGVLYTRRIPVKVIFTTNAPFPNAHPALNESTVRAMERFLGPTELLEANETLQFDDYSKYDASGISETERRKSREERFPKDLQRAYEAGRSICIV